MIKKVIFAVVVVAISIEAATGSGAARSGPWLDYGAWRRTLHIPP